MVANKSCWRVAKFKRYAQTLRVAVRMELNHFVRAFGQWPLCLGVGTRRPCHSQHVVRFFMPLTVVFVKNKLQIWDRKEQDLPGYVNASYTTACYKRAGQVYTVVQYKNVPRRDQIISFISSLFDPWVCLVAFKDFFIKFVHRLVGKGRFDCWKCSSSI